MSELIINTTLYLSGKSNSSAITYFKNINDLYNIVDVANVIISVPLIDYLLINILGKRARWFQLHCVVNLLITYLIKDDIYYFIFRPLSSIKDIDSYLPIYYIVYLHSYHFFIKKLYLIELVHHILFVFMGVFPCIFFWKNNLINLWVLSGCGFPGAIDYFTLSLVKNNMLSIWNQKYISSMVNNYLRLPISIYGLTITYAAYMENIIEADIYFLIYVCLLIYINGTFFNKLAIENYIKYKYTNKIDYNI